MNIRFYNARILVENSEQKYQIIEGELWVEGNRISYVGSATEAADVCENPDGRIWDREIDAKRNLLMPGFKNAHTHSAMTFLRSAADDMALADWLNNRVFPMEERLTGEAAYTFAKIAIMEYLSSGITSACDMYIYPKEVIQAAIDTGFRIVQVSGLNNFTASLQVLEDEYARYNHHHELCSYLLGFHAEYTTRTELIEGVSRLANKYQAPVFMHNAETKQEVDACKKRHGYTPTRLFEELGIYNYGGGGYHCIWMEEEDIEVFANRGLSVVTNPASNLKLASGIAPIHRYHKRGINVAIGTDGAASNNCLDMFREMFLVAGLAKVNEQDATVMKGEDVLRMAIAGGAKAMGLADCDSLAVGKKADIAMIDMAQPNMQPENDIIRNLVYSGSKSNVKMTMVNGRILYEDGEYFINENPTELYFLANRLLGELR